MACSINCDSSSKVRLIVPSVMFCLSIGNAGKEEK